MFSRAALPGDNNLVQTGVAVGNFTSDGAIDIVFTNSGGLTQLLASDGTGLFAEEL